MRLKKFLEEHGYSQDIHNGSWRLDEKVILEFAAHHVNEAVLKVSNAYEKTVPKNLYKDKTMVEMLTAYPLDQIK